MVYTLGKYKRNRLARESYLCVNSSQEYSPDGCEAQGSAHRKDTASGNSGNECYVGQQYCFNDC